MAKTIGIIGATGIAGQAITKEAILKGFNVTAIVRNKNKAIAIFGQAINYLEKDAFDLEKDQLEKFDVIIDAFSPSDLKLAYRHIDLATRLISFFRETTRPRLVFILGAGSLKNGKGEHVLDDLEKNPQAQSWIEAPKQQFKEFDFLSQTENVNWVGISPGLIFKAGEAQNPKIGTDTLLYSENHKSETSSGTLAKVILEEIETPTRENERFTVIDA